MQTFTGSLIADNTFVIHGEGGDAYLLQGDSEAIMIDSGMSAHDIRKFAEQLCGQKTRCVINTHSHFDHTAGNGFFDIIYNTEGIARGAKVTMGLDPDNYPLDYSCTIVKDGDIIDVGGRPLQIIELDCHSPGNIAILDINHRFLFPGDELDAGQVLLLPGYAEKPGQFHSKPAASVETYLRAMEKLNTIRSSFDLIFPAHNGAPMMPDWIERFCELSRRILDGYVGDSDCTGNGYTMALGHFPIEIANYRRASWNGASLVYCADLVMDADYANGQVTPATELHRICAAGSFPEVKIL